MPPEFILQPHYHHTSAHTRFKSWILLSWIRVRFRGLPTRFTPKVDDVGFGG